MRSVRSAPFASSVAAAPRRMASAFANVAMGPPDPILGLSLAYNKDTSTSKVNLGVGVYRDDNGAPYVLPSVRSAERRICGQHDFEYAPISGIPKFVAHAQQLAFAQAGGAVADKRVASAQTLSGTGALRVAGEFLNRFCKTSSPAIYVPDPTWGNHIPVFRDSGLKVEKYTYYNPNTKGLNFEAMVADLEKLAPGTAVLLHACAHNPTGVDPTHPQWDHLVDLIQRRGLLPLVDMAYQGFASGDPSRDAYGLRALVAKVPALILCQSFAKSFGLYGQRAGAIHFVCADSTEAERVTSQVKILIRPMYSNPPLFGARVVTEILDDAALEKQWRQDLQGMADRMNGIRGTLVDELKAAGSVRDWNHITNQIGMMAFTGMSKDQVARLKADWHVYMTDDGRAAVTGLNSKNVRYVAEAFHAVTK